MKKFLTLALVTLGLALPVAAQNIGLYSLAPGGGTTIAGATTNVFVPFTNGVVPPLTYWTNAAAAPSVTFGVQTATNALLLPINDFDFAGVTYSAGTMNGATSSTNSTLQIFRSYNNAATFETTPIVSVSSAIASPLTQLTTNLDVHAATTLAFVIGNVGAATLTNVLLNVNLKAGKVQYQQAGIYTGPTTPTPAITSTNWVP